MPRIGEVQRSGREALEIEGLPWLREALPLTEQEKAARQEGLPVQGAFEIIGVRDLPGLLTILWPEIGVSA